MKGCKPELCRSPRDLPSVGELLEDQVVKTLSDEHGEELTKFAVRHVLDAFRRRLVAGKAVDLSRLSDKLEELLLPSQKRVLNLTGTVLHTNLGRAPLGSLLTSVANRLRGYSVLEFDLGTGKRGKRGDAVERLLRWVTGAEAALMVNNCSAAMILLLTVLAKDREVIVSRGELVEIGGGFRIPDILALSGAKLVEVGCTNRTRIADFERAITEDTGMLLSTHRSNFEIVGFTQSPTPDELMALGKKHDIPVVYDLGSGMLTPVVEGEPSVGEAARFDLAAFSGDKLMGGPQCGVIMGCKDLVERCRKHPFYRAFRCDKLTLALMEEVLRRHANAPESVPTVELLKGDLDSLKERATRFLKTVESVLPGDLSAQVVETEAQVGGGSLPGGSIPSFAVELSPNDPASAQKLQKTLRGASTPIIVRLEKGRAYLDFRSLPSVDDEELSEGFRRVFT
jgi:L-seryl-tRNA(Ser) seleniumtransferase